MNQKAPERVHSEPALIAAVFYLFVSLALGGWTFMRGLETAGCGEQCDFNLIGYTIVPFLWVDAILLVIVIAVFLVLWFKRMPVLWLPVSALIFIAIYAVVANTLFSVALTTGTR